MATQPKLMNFMRMREILSSHLKEMREHLYFSQNIGIIHGSPDIFRTIIMNQRPPFAIDDYRFGIILRGHITVNFNLVEKHLEPGTIAFIGPGTVITPVSFSDDLELLGLVLFEDFPMPFPSGQLPSAFNGQVRDFQLKVSENDFKTARTIIDTVWHIVHQKDYSPQTVSGLIAALMYHYDDLYRKEAEVLHSSQSREQTIFDRFIYLVNQYAMREHKISFYASKMCITEHYLSTIIHQASGVTAKEWIDRALVTRIKVELKHTDKTIAQIAYEFNFTNSSFFCKYFKRMSGITPLAFRNE